MNDLKKDSYCSFCGAEFVDQKKWPRQCLNCHNISYKNPLPVVVVLQPVVRRTSLWTTQYGILIQQRAIEPEKGKWALIGGYIDNCETWQQAAVREVKEEMGIDIDINHLELFDVTSSSLKNNILISCVVTVPLNAERQFDTPSIFEEFIERKQFPNSEVMAVDVMWDEMELAFPAHTEWANSYLKKLKEDK